MSVTAAAMLLGACLLGAVLLAVGAFRTPMPHLARTLTSLNGDPATGGVGADGAPAGGLVDRWGAWLLRGGRLSPSERQLAQLRLRGISLTRFYGERVASAVLCALIVSMVSFM